MKSKKHPQGKQLSHASSMGQAEAVTGISKDFQRWAKQQGCTAFKASRVFLEPLKAYHKEHGEEWEGTVDDGSQEAVNRERIIMLRKQQRKLDMEYQTASGELVRKTDVLEMQGKLIGRWLDIMKRCLSRTDFNLIAKQFQAAPFETL